jgi:formylglycine-generating enzyme required for sulfatase activity
MDVYGLAMTGVFGLYRKKLPMQAFRNTPGFIERLPCSSEVKEVLTRGVEWDVSKRYQEINDFREDLATALDFNLVKHGTTREFPLSNGAAVEMVWLKGGTFTMGSCDQGAPSDEKPHEVTLTKGFWLGVTQVSQAQWQAVMSENPSHFKGDELPVEQVSWNDVMAFIDKVNQDVKGPPFRLPTEAEWEYACRAGTRTAFAFGNTLTIDQVNWDGRFAYSDGPKGVYRAKTVPVKSFNPNPWGFYQMHGNVREWCSDWYGSYPKRSVKDPTGPDTGESRVLRGGGWLDSGRSVRSAFRLPFVPGCCDHDSGFRLARD